MGQHADVIEAFWAAVEAGEISTARGYVAGDAEFIQPGMPPLRGEEALAHMLAGWRRAFPDLRHEVTDVIEAGDTVAVQLLVRGTHTGPMVMPDGQELAPTGAEIVWESVDWIKLRDGKIASWRVYQDNVPFLTALGLLPDPSGSPAERV